MKQILFFLFSSSIVILGCSSARNVKSSAVKQGITGFVTEVRGNQMPNPDAAPKSPKGIHTTVFVYEPTHISDVTREGTSPVYTAIHTKLVASIETDSTGGFTVALPPRRLFTFCSAWQRILRQSVRHKQPYRLVCGGRR